MSNKANSPKYLSSRQLSALLKEFNLDLTRKEKEALLQYTAPTIQKRIQKLAEARVPAVDPATECNPNKLLSRMDGRTSYQSYVVVAVRGESGVVAVRRISEDFKVKFYPNLEHWDFTEKQLLDMGAFSFMDRRQYRRLVLFAAGVEKLIEVLKTLPGVKCASWNNVQRALNNEPPVEEPAVAPKPPAKRKSAPKKVAKVFKKRPTGLDQQ